MLDKYIADAYDEAMQPYYNSDSYKKLNSSSLNRIEALRSKLPGELKQEFNNMINTLTLRSADISEQAFIQGVKTGIDFIKK